MEEPVAKGKLEADKGFSQPEPEYEDISDDQHLKASIIQNQDTPSLTSSPDPLSSSSAESKDNLNTPNLKDDATDR